MWWLFKKKKKPDEDDYVSIWKHDFSDCVAADYLPDYSVCQCQNNNTCRHVARYAGMTLCGNPLHKSFIPEGAERFDPHKGQFSR
ncbi:MAG: hypothetical protein K9M54_01535 [Kiritimatiellales bacterium]|nr:hypothetical protein [Kiritimatiellales bacterium]MCF7864829.1 hypothetical protein [Kiritimatiellales bacterium]